MFQLRSIYTGLDAQYIPKGNILKDENTDLMCILQDDLLDIGVLITQPLKFCSETLKQHCRDAHAFSLILNHIVHRFFTKLIQNLQFFLIKKNLRSGVSGIYSICSLASYSWKWLACKLFHELSVQVEITAFLYFNNIESQSTKLLSA